MNVIDSHNLILDNFQVEGMPGGTIHVKIYVMNTGDNPDTYTLSVTDPKGWGATISPTTLDVQNGKNVIAVLSIPVPSGAALGAEDSITVRADGTGVFSENYVIARAANTLRPSYEDTFIRSSPDPSVAQDKNKPESMYIGWYNPDAAYENAYLKFDLRGIKYGTPIDASHQVILAVYAYSSWPTPGGPRTNFLCYYVDNDTWTEDNLTWNSPPNPNYRIDNLIDNKYFENVDYPGAWLYWDVTRYAKYEFEKGDNILSVCIVSQGPFGGANSPSLSTRTKEYSTLAEQPYLSIGGRTVSMTVDPTYRYGLRGGKFNFTVTVTNTSVPGLPPENYNLSISDNTGINTWSPQLGSVRFENVLQGESRTTNFWAIAPAGAPIGVENQEEIDVTVKSDDNGVSGSSFVRCTVSSDSLYPTADDAWVSSGYPDNNILYYGGSAGDTSFMRIQSFTENYMNDRAFIKFDLSAIPPLGPDDYIENATLDTWLWSTYADDMDVQLLTVDNDNWVEENITWNNQPAFGDVLTTNTLTNYPVNLENSWIYWDVTPWIANNVKYGDNIASFCFKAEVENTSGGYQIDGKEWKTPWQTPILHVLIGSKKRAVSVSISPVHRIGDNGVTENYTVKVMSMGNAIDNFTLTSTADNTNWTRTFDNENCYNVFPGKSVTRTLSVTLPAGAAPGALNNIKVTATGTGGSPPSDSENCSASVKKNNSWVVAGYAPRIDNYGVAVTNAENYIYVANSNTLGTRVNFMRYDPTAGGSWTYLATPANGSPFKNGTVLAWNGGNYIYALGGGAENDRVEVNGARHWFYRYHIDSNWWEFLDNTGNTDNNSNLGAQGAGDALVAVGSYVYAIVGNRYIGSTFWKYIIATNTWTQLALPAAWSNSTDDGCSLVSTGGDYLYAFQGQAITVDNSFYRYSIPENSWTKMADAPAGVDDGGSLLWLGGDNIYALLGGNPSNENIRDNCFSVYSQKDNSWTQLENLPQGIGDPNGQRMGGIGGKNIYVWRGAANPTGEYNPVLWVYTLPPTLEEQISLHLLAGWNLVGFPLEDENATPANLFAGKTYTMYYWNAPFGPYKSPPATKPVEDNRGYWVKVNENTTITYSGIRSSDTPGGGSKTMRFLTGWNLVCFPWTSANTTPDNLFAGTTYTMYYWTAPYGPYIEPTYTLPVEDNRGYWVRENQNLSVQIPI